MYTLTLLGASTIVYGEQTLPVTNPIYRVLLAYLALDTEQTHPRSRLAAKLWPDVPDKTAHSNLRQALYRLRPALAPALEPNPAEVPPLLLVKRNTLAMDRAVVRSDVDYFQSALARAGMVRPGSGETDATLQGLQDVVTCYQGLFLADIDPENCGLLASWIHHKRAQYTQKTIAALQRLMTYYIATDTPELAVANAQRLVTLDPWAEDAHQVILRGLTQQGQRRAALDHFTRLRQLSTNELDVDLSVEILALVDRIRDGAVVTMNDGKDLHNVAHLTMKSSELINPYKGLAVYRSTDTEQFFGRDRVIHQLQQAIQNQAIVALIGASGSGKSSIVQAGLIPRLRRPASDSAPENDMVDVAVQSNSLWQTLIMRPGRDPFFALATALSSWLPTQPISTLMTAIQGATSIPELLDGQVDHALQEGASTLQRATPSINGTPLPAIDYVDVQVPILNGNGLQSLAPFHQVPVHHYLLVIDQFEEIFTLCSDPDRCKCFLDLLVATIDPAVQARHPTLSILLIMRADFMIQVAAHAGLANALQAATIILPSMDQDEVRQAIEEPVRQQGIGFEAGLVARIVSDLGDEPGRLPLLQFALDQLWQRQRNGWLTHDAYEEIEQVQGALAHYADGIYARLAPEEQLQARRIFLQLVQPGDMTADTSRPVTRCELGDDLWPMVQYLADRRLLVTNLLPDHTELWKTETEGVGEESVEVIHETLIREWGRLREWLTEDRAFWLWLRRLRTMAEVWQAQSYDSGALPRGALLAEAERRLADRYVDLPSFIQEFIQASVAQREREAVAAQAQRDREHALLLTMMAKTALDRNDTDLALAMALKANQVTDPPVQARSMLSETAYAPGTRQLLSHEAAVFDLALHPTQRYVFTATKDGSVTLWDGKEGTALTSVSLGKAAIHAIAISPNGKNLLCGTEDGSLLLLPLAMLCSDMLPTAIPIDSCKAQRWRGTAAAVTDLVFHPTEPLAFSAAADGTVTLWEIPQGRVRRCFCGHQDAVLCIAVSPDGRHLLSGSADRSLMLWDVGTGKLIRHMAGRTSTLTTAQEPVAPCHYAKVWDLAFTPDGQRAISVSLDQHLLIWDLRNGQVIDDFVPNHQGLNAVAVSADGRSLLIGTHGGAVIHWPLIAGQGKPLTLPAHQARVTAVDFRADSQIGFSASADGTVRIWNLQSGAALRQLHDYHPTAAVSVALSPDGLLGATAMFDGDIWLWDYATGRTLRKLRGHTEMPFAGLLFTPDNRRLVSGSGDVFGHAKDTTVRVWDVASGKQCQIFDGHTDRIWDIAISPNGKWVASAGGDGELWLWDLQTGMGHRLIDRSPQVMRAVCFSPDGACLLYGLGGAESHYAADYRLCLVDIATGSPLRYFVGHEDIVTAVAISPNGQWALSASHDGALLLWRIADAKIRWRLKGHTSGIEGLAFSPDGRLAATSDNHGPILIWDVEAGNLLARLQGHERYTLSLVFTPDGQRLSSAAADGTVREWRIDRTAAELHTWIEGHRYQPILTDEDWRALGVENDVLR